MMKILLVGPIASPLFNRLWVNLKTRGYKVIVASHNADGIEGVINLGKLTSFGGFLYFWKIIKIVKEHNPDLVHAHKLSHYGLMCIFQPKPLLVALWGSEVMVAPYEGNYFKMTIIKMINRLVLIRATRLHTSARHVAEEAIRQSPEAKGKVDIFYWGFPLVKPDLDIFNSTRKSLKKEFGINKSRFIIFTRGVGSIYNPVQVSKIINILLQAKLEHRIVVLKVSSQVDDVQFFSTLVDMSKIVFVNRLLNQVELYYLYSNSDVHFSIPLSDALGGGAIEPALLGSYPILSNLPSYRDYISTNNGYIIDDCSEKNIIDITEKIKSSKILNSVKNKPVDDYSLDAIMEKFDSCYDKVMDK